MFGATTTPDLTAGYTSGGLRACKPGPYSQRTHFLYDGVALIIEFHAQQSTAQNPDDGSFETFAVIDAVNTFGSAGLISRRATWQISPTQTRSESRFFAFDERGNVVLEMNGTATRKIHAVYDAYGKQIGEERQNSLTPGVGSTPEASMFRFGGQAGYYTDSETGLVLCTLRYYDPQVGRWLTRDPAGYGGGMNLYAYCYGNPTNSLDPLGLCSGGSGGGGGNGPDQWYDTAGRWSDAASGAFDKSGLSAMLGPARSMTAKSVLGTGAMLRTTGHMGERPGHWAGGEATFENIIGTGEDILTAFNWVGMAGPAAKSIGNSGFNNCFVAGTPVQMADGTTKPIEEVKADDRVKSRDEATGKDVAKRVVRTFVNEVHGTLLTLRFDNGEEVTTTAGHPFYVEGKGFILAGELGVGTSIVTRAGPHTASRVVAVTRHPKKSATIYNFEVEGTHTYFVGTRDGGVWVHNTSFRSNPSTQMPYLDALKEARDFMAGRETRYIYDRNTGTAIGKVTTDNGPKLVLRYPHTDSGTPQLHYNMENHATGVNNHVIIKPFVPKP